MSTTQGVQILVADDERSVRRGIKLLLEPAGYTVCVADGVEAALEQLTQRNFDLVITDFSMPGMPGDQLVAHMRKLLPAGAVIMAMAFPDEYAVFGLPNGQVDALLLKPCTLTELHAAIKHVLARQPPDRPTRLGPEANRQPVGYLSAPASEDAPEHLRRVNDFRPCLFALD